MAQVTAHDAPRDYGSVHFPHDTKFVDGQLVRLYGAMGDTVFGVAFYRSSYSGEESMSQALTWSLDGIYGGGGYPTMNLMPPPGKAQERIASIEKQAQEARDRLASYPDAPPEWRAIDERKVREAEDQIAKLLPPMEQAA